MVVILLVPFPCYSGLLLYFLFLHQDKFRIKLFLKMTLISAVWLFSALILLALVIYMFPLLREYILAYLACALFVGLIILLITIWKRKMRKENKEIGKKHILLLIPVIIGFILVVTPFIKLPVSNESCYGKPLVRWKFAIYYGEYWGVDGEGGESCDFTKIEGTGWREYFGLKDIGCPCNKK